ncbi:hypothetical protein Tdes44962_MAKER09383 [Teratosphaeria destructans]|uniref:DUF1996 domain-containing protein n=1 Tax=Teratosphaeria destructans TaxID=418781 RepID=A0A9W7SU22_9PEZI|nr:hypothetical protein Tdes44962_MAKER09383 [Teratosphaeria destructans]
MRSQAAISIALASLAGSASAFWRMPCRSQTGKGRLDPIVDRGEVSGHVHTIHGGGGFSFDADYQSLNSSNCTSCEVTQDHSAYWTPALYFQYSNGTSIMVDQVGGMLAYYLYYLENVTAFPEGFVMVAGNPRLRSFEGPFPDTELSSWPTDPVDQFFLQQRALGFNCLDYSKDPEASLYRHQFPSKDYMDANCLDGLRLEFAFPSCWNGSLDSSDHKSHVKYPSLVKEGNCPEGYDQHLPFLFYETIWNTYAFKGEDGQFLFSYGDPVGTGYHADFMMGWESQEFLQNALDTCQSSSGQIQDCPLFNIQSDEVAAECKFEMPDDICDDEVLGPRNGLPVDVPIQYGPANATNYKVAGRPGVSTTPISASISTISNALTYSAADPSKTSTALGGIVVDHVSLKHNKVAGTGETAWPSTTATSFTTFITPAPSSHSADIVSTICTTENNAVYEIAIEQVDVTVTVSPTETAAPYQKRHLQRHAHHHHQRL